MALSLGVRSVFSRAPISRRQILLLWLTGLMVQLVLTDRAIHLRTVYYEARQASLNLAAAPYQYAQEPNPAVLHHADSASSAQASLARAARDALGLLTAATALLYGFLIVRTYYGVSRRGSSPVGSA